MTHDWIRTVARRWAVDAIGLAGVLFAAGNGVGEEPAAASAQVFSFSVNFDGPSEVAPPLTKGNSAPAAPACAAASHASAPSILSKIPYLSRLFKNVAADECDCCERIGVDFDLTGAPGGVGELRILPTGEQVVVFGEGQLPQVWTGGGLRFSVPAVGQCQAPPTAVVACPDGKCPQMAEAVGPDILLPFGIVPHVFQPSNAAPTHAAVAVGQCVACPACATVTAKRAPQGGQVALYRQQPVGPSMRYGGATALASHTAAADRDGLIEQLVEVSIEKAKLEAQEGFVDQLVETMIEKTKLEARVEALKEREILRDELVQLATKNAALEAKLEFQKEQFAMLQKLLELSSENEQLKKRLESFEKRSLESALPR